MTAGVLLRIILRRWAVVLLGLALTLVGCTAIAGAERTYGASVDLVFVEPGRSSVVNASDAALPSLVDFARMVQRGVRYDSSMVELPSSNATLYGSGVKNGYSVTLPNSGTQWAESYSRPILAVQVVGATPEQVRQKLDQVLSLVESQARDIQTASGISGNRVIDVRRSPAVPEIGDLGSTKLGRMKGILALSLLGLTLTAIGAIQIDRLLLRRSVAGVPL